MRKQVSVETWPDVTYRAGFKADGMNCKVSWSYAVWLERGVFPLICYILVSSVFLYFAQERVLSSRILCK
jgi:hypothetical protein